MKAKQFWIEIGQECDHAVWTKNPHNPAAIHTIVYKAYESIKREHDMMREALEYYSRARHLTITVKDGHHDKHIVDNGGMARRTLELIK